MDAEKIDWYSRNMERAKERWIEASRRAYKAGNITDAMTTDREVAYALMYWTGLLEEGLGDTELKESGIVDKAIEDMGLTVRYHIKPFKLVKPLKTWVKPLKTWG